MTPSDRKPPAKPRDDPSRRSRSSNEDARANRSSRGVSRPQLDELDIAIIRQLQVDGRMPFSKLGPLVGLSEGAARQRVARLLESGRMQVAAVVDPLASGSQLMALVGVRTSGDTRKIARAISELPEAIYVVVISGSFDIVVELVCDSNSHLLDVVTEGLRSLPGVATTETFMYLDVCKHVFTYAVR